MKKLLLIITGLLVLGGTAIADCGTCEGSAADAQKKASCKIKQASEKIPCALKKTGCKKKNAAKRAVCPKRIEKEKALLEQKAACEKEAACDKNKSEKKWWKFGFGK